ncbi:DNA cytosine methyltransferase [Rhizobium sp. S152]|uniref:DNA cytosine methyltransferase n=1 Tax=Rhizobium sp. S152 TaxID=3055038 RepID=UPI0025A99BBA|nr:DNA cytosine methyltransferase [Rhizobium sp. S152]MDM9627843.1 DNA cytosine methyltransferase [Rhizobium sp. S152]
MTSSRDTAEIQAAKKLAKQKAATLRDAKADLETLCRKQTEYFLKIADEVRALKASVSGYEDFDLVGWLQSTLGISVDEATAYATFDADLISHRETFIKFRTSPETIKALALCDVALRSECIEQIELNVSLNAGIITKRREDKLIAEMSAEDLAMLRRQEIFDAAASQAGTALAEKLEDGAKEILRLLSLNTGEETESMKPSSEVATKAADVRDDFYRLLGPFLPRHGRDKIEERVAIGAIVSAYYSLERLIKGKPGPWKGIDFLAGIRSFAVDPLAATGPQRSPWRGPNFLDIDAGVGRMAIGLAAAGFFNPTLFARTTDEFSAIVSNKTFRDVREVRQDAFISQIAKLDGSEIDLVTCGIPWYAYKSGDSRQAFQNSLYAVETLRPKAFVFEAYSQELDVDRAQSFEDAGYDVKWYSLDSSRFELAQNKVRHVMIGSRDGLLANFVMPRLNGPKQVYLDEVIGDLLGGHVWSGPVSPLALENYTSALAALRKKYATVKAPPFPNFYRRGLKRFWTALNVDPKGFADVAPALEDLENPAGFQLSTAMVKRIVSFPDDWNVESAYSSNAQKVSESFPPKLARMIGLAVHSALSGTDFDYEIANRLDLIVPVPASNQDLSLFNMHPHYPGKAIVNPNKAIYDLYVRYSPSTI